MHLITGGFDFDRTDFVHTCDQEIYLALVFAVIGLEGVVEKTVSRSCEYLRYYIFKKVSQIGRKLIIEDFFINDVLSKIAVLEHQGREQSCVTYKQLEL